MYNNSDNYDKNRKGRYFIRRLRRRAIVRVRASEKLFGLLGYMFDECLDLNI